jgi:hypothetical protein
MELESAVERLYTDESLAADVDDKTAKPLLKWAETLLPTLISRGDAGFDEAFVTLKKLVKSVARLIDMRGEIDATERAERAEKIQAFAQELGVEVNIDNLEALATSDGPELVAQIVGGVSSQPAALPQTVAETKRPIEAQSIDEAQTSLTSEIGVEPAATVPDTPETRHSVLGGIRDFFERFADSLDADPENPDTKE